MVVVNTEQGKLKRLLETGVSYAKEMQKKSKFATHSPVQVIDFIFFRLMIAHILLGLVINDIWI